MSASTVTIQPVSPLGCIPPVVQSSGKHIIRSRLAEIQPTSQTRFSYSTNSQLVFDINSPTDFADFKNSYLRFNLNCSLTNNAVESVQKYLSEGGAHSLIKTLTIETASGTLIQRIDDYNKLYSCISQASHSKEYVNDVLFRCGDSVDYRRQAEPYGQPAWRPMEVITSASGTATVLTGTGTKFLSEIEVGDILRLNMASVSYIVKVATVTSDTNLTYLTGIVPAGPTVFTSIDIWRENTLRGVDPARKLAANTADYLVVMQPMAPFLMMEEFIPLYLIRGGLKITLTLDRPEFCLCVPSEPVGSGFAIPPVSSATFEGVVISNPVWCVQMLEPSQELSKVFLDMFRSEGIAYTYTGFKHYLDTCGNGLLTQNTNINSNVRSARYIITKIQNDRANSVLSATASSGLSTYTADCIAQGLKAGLRYLQYSSGSERFPLSRPLDLQSASNSEALIHIERVFGHTGNTDVCKRFYPAEWQSVKNYIKEYESTEAVDSSRLLLGADLSRDDSSWAGLDLSLSPLRAELQFTSTYLMYDKDGVSNPNGSTRYLHHFIAHDTCVLMSDAGIVCYS